MLTRSTYRIGFSSKGRLATERPRAEIAVAVELLAVGLLAVVVVVVAG